MTAPIAIFEFYRRQRDRASAAEREAEMEAILRDRAPASLGPLVGIPHGGTIGDDEGPGGEAA